MRRSPASHRSSSGDCCVCCVRYYARCRLCILIAVAIFIALLMFTAGFVAGYFAGQLQEEQPAASPPAGTNGVGKSHFLRLHSRPSVRRSSDASLFAIRSASCKFDDWLSGQLIETDDVCRSHFVGKRYRNWNIVCCSVWNKYRHGFRV